ncbi:TPA: restriction endonuclease subunit S [Klebsiella pneumoniae]|jgi:type I restriction enzyme S subunit|uniref:restriction endonuclease subunit S n=1 Tax=Klebsiella TaxID=570 RepID=UPI000C9AB03D|nr:MULTISPECIES: restriction endonuclease subunit S [Klebsiella]EKW7372050.1 restriction endonuclease subunit S [Klebsiella pneumoniae]AYW21702.1 restriction endonuclease subunit S [Klebsiella sp. P1CD1]EIY5142683.1 restriction endonuclease subunit S [Klebsiella variicola]EKU2796173.1 restriction endonuclease subunit S [Klebsiella variicola]MBT9337772.1 restriction endonuclease subunit S [Klebsiella sp. O852]
MAKYKAYPEYKDSGVEWLGVIPKGWTISKVKYLAPFQVGWTPPTKNDANFIGDNLWVNISDLKDKFISSTAKCISDKAAKEASMDITPRGSLLYSFKLSVGAVSFAGCDLYTNEAIASFLDQAQLPLSYLYYALPIFIIENASTNIYGAKILNQELIKNSFLLAPSHSEAKKVAKFLDHETAKIDNLIEKQQQLIELLKEKRQAVISHAVTKGLNPDVPMKDSGVEWLGKVPEDWQLKQIRHLCTSNGGGTPSKSNPNFWVGNIPWVSPKDMKVQYISDAEDHVSEDAVKQSSTKKIPIGSVLIVVRGMILAHSVPVAINTKVVTINQDMKALVPNENISCDYLHLVLSGLKRILLELTDNSAHGTKCLRTDLFEKLWIPLPSLTQQKTIISEINEKVIKIDDLIHLQEEAKALLQERRTALISAAVTGKIDVRDWVAPDTQDVEEPQEATA